MDIEELKELIKLSESEQIEFKLSTGQRTEAAKTVCAMLNCAGGFLLFGIDDKGNIKGQQVSSKTLEIIAGEIRRIEPPAYPDIETVPLNDNLKVIVLRVPGGGGPYTYDGRPYIRNGSSTAVMPQYQYEKLLLERMHGSYRWEKQIARNISIKDLDREEIIRTIDEAVRRQRLTEPGTRKVKDLLTGLGLLQEDNVINAAVVLFGKSKSLLPGYIQCTLKLARFRGTDKTEFIDNRQITGNAFELFEQAQIFFRNHLPVSGKILPDKFERVDEPLYPTAALREAVANAICHRDYGSGAGAISIAIYDDRLEISSTGELHFGLKTEDLFRPHPSRPWNPFIAKVFYLRGIIETWGRGTIKIKELTDEARLPVPEFENNMGEFTIRFFCGKKYSDKISDLVGTMLAPCWHHVGTMLELSTEEINKLLISCNEATSINDLMNIFAWKDRSKFRNKYINPLLEEGLIEMTVPDKPKSSKQKYKITEKGNYLLEAGKTFTRNG